MRSLLCLASSRAVVGGLLSLGFVLGACNSSPEPSDYPYRLEEVARKGEPIQFVDLDQDSHPEEIHAGAAFLSNSGPVEERSLTIKVHEGRTIDQVNYAGSLVQSPQVLDLEADGRKELLVPFLRNDSLFLSIVGTAGTKRGQFFVTKGQPRQEPEGPIPWDPQVRGAYRADANGDGEPELVTIMMTRLARQPRGLWIHDLQTGERVASWTSGAMVDAFALRDVDRDGTLDFIGASSASNNGAEGRGLDDQHAYLFRVSLGTEPSLVWKRDLGGLWTRSKFRSGDINGDGTEEWVVFRRYSEGRPAPSRLEIFDPESGRPLRHAQLEPSARDVELADLSGNGVDGILVLHRNGQLELRDETLKVSRSRHFELRSRGMRVLEQIAQRGADRVFATGQERIWVVGPDLVPEAYRATSGRDWQVVPQPNAPEPRLAARSEERTVLYAYRSNPAQLVHRYGPALLWLLGLGGVLGLGWLGWTLHRRYETLKREREVVLEAGGSARLLIDPEGSIERINEPARRLLGISDPSPSWDLLEQSAPELPIFLEQMFGNERELDGERASEKSGEEVRHEETLRVGPEETPATVRARPIRATWGGDGRDEPKCLVEIDPEEGTAAQTWRLMTQRVAHDLRNPLTSILLTVQRMQMTYREQVPEVAEELDAYAERIESQVQRLRRTATNVMKVVGAEVSTRTRTDLAKLLREGLRPVEEDLPPDVTLEWDLSENVPPIQVDPEQIVSVFENLLYNAVEAMPEGGRITLRAEVVRELQFVSDPAARDYLMIEVLDTGTGMDAATQARATEPGFTTEPGETGLGLAIAEKIVGDHDGHLEIESESGVGTAVSVYLPVDKTGDEIEDKAEADGEMALDKASDANSA